MDNLIDMEAVNRKYYEKSGLKITTNKNQAADLLREVASAIGADLNLIKEGQLANQRFVIHESDLNHIFKMLSIGQKCLMESACAAGTIGVLAVIVSSFSLKRSATSSKRQAAPREDATGSALQCISRQSSLL